MSTVDIFKGGVGDIESSPNKTIVRASKQITYGYDKLKVRGRLCSKQGIRIRKNNKHRVKVYVGKRGIPYNKVRRHHYLVKQVQCEIKKGRESKQ